MPAALTQSDLEGGKFYRVLTGDPASVPTGYDPEFARGLDNADWKLAKYSDPRADLLMFFSNRPTVSQAPPPNPDPRTNAFGAAAAAGVKLAPVRVLYGHAALGTAVWSGGGYAFPTSLQHVDTPYRSGDVRSQIPANHWHLARLATIINPSPGTSNGVDDVFLPVARNFLPQCQPYPLLGPTMPGDAATLNLTFLLGGYGDATTLPLVSPYTMYGSTPGVQPQIDTLLYSNIAGLHHVATVLDNVPVELQSNLGVHMLPGCAWFQVEFLMPEDPRNSVQFSGNPIVTGSPGRSHRWDMPLWTSIVPGETYIFVPDTRENRNLVAQQGLQSNPGDRIWTFARLDQTAANDPNDAIGQRVIRMWPYAIRITVRVYDPRGRLSEPIVRSIVHRFE